MTKKEKETLPTGPQLSLRATVRKADGALMSHREPIPRNREKTLENVLQTATVEFAERGYQGARISQIASTAGIDKRLIYYYFANKEALFTAVIERAYQDLRQSDESIFVDYADPVKSLSNLLANIVDRSLEARYAAALIADENKHRARHILQSKTIRVRHSSLMQKLEDILDAGVKSGDFRADVDPVYLFVSVLGMSTIFCTNCHTLSAIFGRALGNAEEIGKWRAHVVDLAMKGVTVGTH